MYWLTLTASSLFERTKMTNLAEASGRVAQIAHLEINYRVCIEEIVGRCWQSFLIPERVDCAKKINRFIVINEANPQ